MHLHAHSYAAPMSCARVRALRLVGGCTRRQNNVWGVTVGKAPNNSGNVRVVTAGQVGHNSSDSNVVSFKAA